MEYGTYICTENCNDQFIKHVGFSDTSVDGKTTYLQYFFSIETRTQISNKVSELLIGVDSHNRKIIVPDEIICSVMSAVYESFRPEIGDIYTRYIIPTPGRTNYLQRMIDMTINTITTNIKNTVGMKDANEKLTIWTTLLGDFNEHGLRQHAPIKVRERRPSPMLFQMNY